VRLHAVLPPVAADGTCLSLRVLRPATQGLDALVAKGELMRSPTRAMAANLRWTRSGVVWADFLLSGAAYGYRPHKEKRVVRDMHTGLFRALPGESLLLGVRAGLNPAAIVERMIEGIDLDACPDWAAECAATLDTLDVIRPGQRIYWLSVPLSDNRASTSATGSLRAAMDELRDSLALPRAGVPAKEIERRLEQSRRIAAAIPWVFRPQPATPAQMIWLDLHAQQRGLATDMEPPESSPTGDVERSPVMPSLLTGSAMLEPLLDEGGQTDLSRAELKAWLPWERRYLKVTQPDVPDAPGASYQAMLVMAGLPTEGMDFPGSEFLGRIDECGYEVDWALRLTTRSGDQAAAQNRRALIKLNDQYGQREGEMSHAMNTLDRVAESQAEFAAVLDLDKLEVEIQATVIFAVAGPTPESASEQADGLAKYLHSASYTTAQPLGYRENLWWAFVPGAPTNKAVREFTQITTSRSLAAAVPLASTTLGDDKGILMALNISGGPPGAVLHDPAGAAVRDISGSLAVCGELGAGKSLMLKMLLGGVVDRGGRILCIDRTKIGEYATWASSVTDAIVVNIADPTFSLDPLRLFGPATGAQIAQSFLTPLTKIKPMSPLGLLLSEVLDPAYRSEHAITGLGGLLAHLKTDCTREGAADLGAAMNFYARRDFGRAIFDDTLPVVPADAAAVIIRTHTLELPRPIELANAHLFDEMRPERTFGRAMYAHIAALARQMSFDDPARLGVFGVDEAHHITTSSEGEHEIAEFVRDGRKHNGAVFLGSHDPDTDFGSETLQGLIPTRILMRHRDHKLAKRGLAWLGLDPEDDALVTMLTEDTSPVTGQGVAEHRRGEAFLRDSSGNIGRIKVLPPSVPERNTAVRTSPPENTELAGASA